MSNRLFNGEALPGGVPDPNEAGRGSPRPDRAGGGFYTFLARDGQARSRADRSFCVAGVGLL